MRGKLLGSHFFGTQNSRMLQKKNVMHIRWDSTEYTGANLIRILSFESFEYEDAEPTVIQRFFLTHKELNIAEFAKRIGINASLMRNYINGFRNHLLSVKHSYLIPSNRLAKSIYELHRECNELESLCLT